MREKDFDKGYKSGFKFGKEVANEEWQNKIKQARDEMQKLRGCSCNCSDGIIDDVEDILDKLIAESEGVNEV